MATAIAGKKLDVTLKSTQPVVPNGDAPKFWSMSTDIVKNMLHQTQHEGHYELRPLRRVTCRDPIVSKLPGVPVRVGSYEHHSVLLTIKPPGMRDGATAWVFSLVIKAGASPHAAQKLYMELLEALTVPPPAPEAPAPAAPAEPHVQMLVPAVKPPTPPKEATVDVPAVPEKVSSPTTPGDDVDLAAVAALANKLQRMMQVAHRCKERDKQLTVVRQSKARVIDELAEAQRNVASLQKELEDHEAHEQLLLEDAGKDAAAKHAGEALRALTDALNGVEL